jgi:hypothetical protein
MKVSFKRFMAHVGAIRMTVVNGFLNITTASKGNYSIRLNGLAVDDNSIIACNNVNGVWYFKVVG